MARVQSKRQRFPDVTPKVFHFIFWVPSRKLTYPLKIDLWKRRFLLETVIFRGYVSFRERILPWMFRRWIWGSQLRSRIFFGMVGHPPRGPYATAERISADSAEQFSEQMLTSIWILFGGEK